MNDLTLNRLYDPLAWLPMSEVVDPPSCRDAEVFVCDLRGSYESREDRLVIEDPRLRREVVHLVVHVIREKWTVCTRAWRDTVVVLASSSFTSRSFHELRRYQGLTVTT